MLGVGAGATTNPIPGLVANYRAYLAGNVLAGTVDVTLPDIEFLTETIKGAGIAGEIELILPMMKAMSANLKWRTITDDPFSLVAQVAQGVTLRSSQVDYDPGAGGSAYNNLIIHLRASAKKIALGKFEVASATDTGVDLNVYYLRIVQDDVELCEIDPLNMRCVISGVDLLATMANML